jgi:hypothetical protein
MFIDGAYHMKIPQVQYLPTLGLKITKLPPRNPTHQGLSNTTSISLKISFDLLNCF